MALNESELTIMRRVLAKEITPKDIPSRKNRLCTCAVVAYILLNRKQYLDECNRLLRPYSHIIRELVEMKFYPDALVTISLQMGFHTSATPEELGIKRFSRRRIITIVPPPELSHLIPPHAR